MIKHSVQLQYGNNIPYSRKNSKNLAEYKILEHVGNFNVDVTSYLSDVVSKQML